MPITKDPRKVTTPEQDELTRQAVAAFMGHEDPTRKDAPGPVKVTKRITMGEPEAPCLLEYPSGSRTIVTQCSEIVVKGPVRIVAKDGRHLIETDSYVTAVFDDGGSVTV